MISDNNNSSWDSNTTFPIFRNETDQFQPSPLVFPYFLFFAAASFGAQDSWVNTMQIGDTMKNLGVHMTGGLAVHRMMFAVGNFLSTTSQLLLPPDVHTILVAILWLPSLFITLFFYKEHPPESRAEMIATSPPMRRHNPELHSTHVVIAAEPLQPAHLIPH